MERLFFRSTSLSDLQAELRQRELLADARRRIETRTARHERSSFRLRLPRLVALGWARG